MKGRETWSIHKPAVHGGGGLVAAQHWRAAEVGAEVLGAGGNAVDAALATSLALAVVEPWMSGLGGGGFMVIARADGTPPEVVDFGMVAPAALDPAAFPLIEGRDDDLFGWPAVQGERNVHGPLSIAVPGQAAGLAAIHQTYATLPWSALCAPAIALAEQGLPVDWHTTLRIANAAAELSRFDVARAIYVPAGLPPTPARDGTSGRVDLGPLADTLRRLADAGPEDLIHGELARLLVDDVRAAGGVLSDADLATTAARRVAPLALERGAATIHVPGGLTAGPTLAQALELSRGRVARGTPDAATYLAWAEALFAAYEHRLSAMGDVDDRRDPACTTHLCVVDGAGTMVSLTQTLLAVFGSKIVSPRTGILLNNGIMWFDPRPGRPNSIAPAKRPLTNMCPVVAIRDGRPWFAVGAAGGRKILPAVFQIASMLADGGLDLETAFHTPRIDASGGDTLVADRRLGQDIRAALAARYPVRAIDNLVLPTLFACPSAVLRDADEGVGMTDVVHPLAAAVAA